MRPQLPPKFRHEKGDLVTFSFRIAEQRFRCGWVPRLVNDLHPHLQSTAIVGEPLGYVPDGNTQPPPFLRDDGLVPVAAEFGNSLRFVETYERDGAARD